MVASVVSTWTTLTGVFRRSLYLWILMRMVFMSRQNALCCLLSPQPVVWGLASPGDEGAGPGLGRWALDSSPWRLLLLPGQLVGVMGGGEMRPEWPFLHVFLPFPVALVLIRRVSQVWFGASSGV